MILSFLILMKFKRFSLENSWHLRLNFWLPFSSSKLRGVEVVRGVGPLTPGDRLNFLVLLSSSKLRGVEVVRGVVPLTPGDRSS